MKKILVFSFFPAFVPPSNGGESRLFNFYRALSGSYQITLLSSSHLGVEEEVINHGAGFIERRIPKDNHFSDQWSVLSRFSGGGDLSGPCVAACGQYPTLLHDAYFEEYQAADLIVHDSPFTVGYDLFAGTDHKPRVYNSYNCEAKLYKQLHPTAEAAPIHELVRSAEQRMLDVADLVLYCSQDDLAEFRELAPSARFDCAHVPHGMTQRVERRPDRSAKQQKFSAVFMGSGHPPNVQAAKFITEVLAPSMSQVSFHIMGSCLPQGDYGSNVLAHGVVDDLSKDEILLRCDIALNPMETGSGANVKVLDYLSYGLPVLSTAFGMRGVDAIANEHYLEASLADFGSTLRRAMSNAAVLNTARDAGCALARRYTWNRIASAGGEHFGRLITNKANSPSRKFVLALNDYDSFATMGGGATRTQGLYAAVSEWSPTVFVCFSNDAKLRSYVFDGITVISVPKTKEHCAEVARVNATFHVAADDIVASCFLITNRWLRAVYGVLRQSARIVVLEHCYMAPLISAYHDRFVYSSQNDETELKTRLLAWHPLRAELLPIVKKLEKFAVENAAATITVSLEDATNLARNRSTSGQVVVVRNGAKPAFDAPVTRLAALRNVINSRSAVFVGSGHMPNVDAVKLIVDKIAPGAPDTQFHIIGSVCDAMTSPPANVRLWGMLDEVEKSAVMQSCDVALNPMASGGGSNVKLADYFANGIFVITTEFGIRGYPSMHGEDVRVAAIEDFAVTLTQALGQQELHTVQARNRRKKYFADFLSMQSLAARFVDTLKSLESRKKRVLYVAYRYSSPTQGGAEVNIEKFVEALGRSGRFDVDVVAPDVSHIHNHMRFGESYSFDASCTVAVDIPNVRFARFPVESPPVTQAAAHLRSIWSTQPRFEHATSQQVAEHYEQSGCAWGWDHPERLGGNASRWAYTECGVFAALSGKVEVRAFSPGTIVVTASDEQGRDIGCWKVGGSFELAIEVERGQITLRTSAADIAADPRPLGFYVSHLRIAGESIDLSAPTLWQRHIGGLPFEKVVGIFDRAAEARNAEQARLTDGRGPWSTGLERFISDQVGSYDLVVTHNNVFRPAVVALAEAKRHGVPSILIPHAHLDDDFYHFPDVLESARNASLVLAAPKAAREFFTSKGCDSRYLPAGCDADETFTEEDVQAFREAHTSRLPFILVLGRKSGAKNYQKVIDAIGRINRPNGPILDVVLIGPDDDGLPVSVANAHYLGRQPRPVVRGALKSCLALCNMSSSESFGIVLLEAWLAGKPVVVEKNCAAFRDLAVDGVNAILVGEDELADKLLDLAKDAALRDRLASSGMHTAQEFSWKSVSDRFVETCDGLVGLLETRGVI